MEPQMPRCCAALCLILLPQLPGAADTSEPPVPAIEEIRVTGEFPGPALWRVSKQDNQNVLWILGALGAEPAAPGWKSLRVEKIVAESQEVIQADQSNLSFDFGMFTMMRYLPNALRARRNPHDRTLEEMLPGDVYERWRLLKAEYIGSDRAIEMWRPFMAAKQLRKEAERRLLPKYSGDQWAAIDRLVQQHGLRVSTPIYEVKIPDENLRSSMKTFMATTLNDVECLDVTMKLVEFWADGVTIQARATAWARGDLDVLRSLPPLPVPDDLCLAAILNSRAVQGLHLRGLEQPADGRDRVWLEAVDRALTANRSTLAIVPIDELLKEDGKLSLLRARGYRVEGPI